MATYRRARQKKAIPPLRWWDHKCIAVIGVMMGLEVGFINKALHDSDLSMRTMLMSTNTAFMLFSAKCWNLPPGITPARLACVSLLVFGGVVQGLSVILTNDSQSTAPAPVRGFIIQMMSMTISAQKWAFVQWVLQSGSPISSLSKVEMSARLLPFAAAVMLIFSLFLEPGSFGDVDFYVGFRLVVLSLLIAILVVSELRLVQISSAVTFFVCGVLHNIPIVLCGVWLFHERITWLKLLGFSLCIIGTLWYGKVTPIKHKKDDFFEPLDGFEFDGNVNVDIQLEEIDATSVVNPNENDNGKGDANSPKKGQSRRLSTSSVPIGKQLELPEIVAKRVLSSTLRQSEGIGTSLEADDDALFLH